MMILRLAIVLLSVVSCFAANLRQPFEYVVAPASEANMRNSEADMLVFGDGRLMLAWTEFYTAKGSDWGPARISAVYSKDKGATWQNKFTLQENIGKMNVMEPDFLRLQSGKVLFLFARKNSEGDCVPMMRRSVDDGVTFSEPKALPIDPSPSYTGFNHDRAIQLRNGRILFPVFFTTDYRVDKHIRSRVYYSDDEGATWQAGKTIVDIPDSRAGAQEPGLVELTAGRIMMWMRTDKGKVYHCYSTDNGDTFSEPTAMALDSPLSPQSIKRIPTTRDLLMVWNYSTKDRFPLTVAISKDDGDTWTRFRNLDQDAAHTYAYTSIEFLEDRALFTYYAGPPAGAKSEPRWSLKLKAVPLDWFYHPYTVVALGDSVTYGYRRDGSVQSDQTFPALLERDLQKTLVGLHVVNAGVGGNTTWQMLERIERDVKPYGPKLVLVMAGLNDAAYIDPGPKERSEPRISVEEYGKNLLDIVKLARADGAAVIVATPNPLTSAYPYANFGWYKGRNMNEALERYVAKVRRVCSTNGIEMVDIYSAYKKWKGYENTLPDGVHPNPAGHRFIADQLMKACRDHVRRWVTRD
ncbi:MAG: exo-alpha-sialidase [Acidobacteriales bacterium]|nr:exo-alpha-sialidase [Terriglobales bacterium]